MIDEVIYSLEVLYKDSWETILTSFDLNKCEQKKTELVRQGYNGSNFRINYSEFKQDKKWNDS